MAILITGASSGIGAAVALRYARPGARLSLWGRDPARLADVAARARAQGAEVTEVVLDIADATAAVREAEAADDAEPIDIAILAAGRGGIRAAGGMTENPHEVFRIMATNLSAPAAMATALAARMAARGDGRIGLVGSVAGMLPTPQAPAYAASKAGLAMFATALRLDLARRGVAITLISPGFIDTPMSQGLATPKPFLMNSARAAELIVRAVDRRARHAIFPWPFALLPALLWLTPATVRNRLLRAIDARPM